MKAGPLPEAQSPRQSVLVNQDDSDGAEIFEQARNRDLLFARPERRRRPQTTEGAGPSARIKRAFTISSMFFEILRASEIANLSWISAAIRGGPVTPSLAMKTSESRDPAFQP
jgi:hypothetical protein